MKKLPFMNQGPYNFCALSTPMTRDLYKFAQQLSSHYTFLMARQKLHRLEVCMPIITAFALWVSQPVVVTTESTKHFRQTLLPVAHDTRDENV
jgi:hypothetical protein